uniref:Uncharacterized protein n=1 Tax=Trichuris muris TaxID=70415 RepID=A0A5S6QZF9_TRIMR
MQITVEMSKDTSDSELLLIELQGRLINNAGGSFAGHKLGALGFKHDGTPFLVIGRQILYGEVVTLPKPVVALRKKAASETDRRGYDIVSVVRSKICFKTRPKNVVTSARKH